MLNLMKAGLVALAIGGVGLAGLAPAEAATFVAGGPGGHVAIHTGGPGYGYGDRWHHRHWHRHQVRVCTTHWHHHHPVRVCRLVWR